MNRLLEIQRDLCNQSYEEHDFARDGDASMLGVPFVPVIEGASLPKHPETAAREGRTAAVPMMIGCTTGEHVTTQSCSLRWTSHFAPGCCAERVLPRGLAGSDIVKRYRMALPNQPARHLARDCRNLVFQLPTIRFARLHARFQSGL